jgi:hypothetical protein
MLDIQHVLKRKGHADQLEIKWMDGAKECVPVLFSLPIMARNLLLKKIWLPIQREKQGVFYLKWPKSNRILFWGRLSCHLCREPMIIGH